MMAVQRYELAVRDVWIGRVGTYDHACDVLGSSSESAA